MFSSGTEILHNKYRLLENVPIALGVAAEAWTGVFVEDDTRYFIKIWPFSGKRPDDLSRALWDTELRNLYRVCSSPGAEDAILVLRDAGVDLDNHCYVMVLEAPGYERLDSAIKHRRGTEWLDIGRHDLQGRSELWTSLQKLASGVQLLHEQRTLHRNLQPAAIFYNKDIGARSMRLGGFEWSIRLGAPSSHGPTPSPNWSSPPEFFRGTVGYRPETDWFGFGMLAVRLLVNVEASTKKKMPHHRYEDTLLTLNKSSLSDLEREFLLRLIARKPRERLDRGEEIVAGIDKVLRGLRQASMSGHEQKGALTVVIPPMPRDELLERAQVAGFVPDPNKPNEPFNPRDVVHVASLTEFIQCDLDQPQLYAVPRAHFYLLVGSQLTLQLTQFEYTDRATHERVRNWNFAFCPNVAELRWNDGGSACVQLPPGKVVVRTRREALRGEIRQNALDWEPYLPTIDAAVALRAELARFHDFIRCTNQLELLIRDSEIFRYRGYR